MRLGSWIPTILLLFVLLVFFFLWYGTHLQPSTVQQVVPVLNGENLALDDGQASTETGFNIKNVPSWLFVHVSIIAMLQISALFAAYVMSRAYRLSKAQIATIQFLCEIPMYLGLFGTLLGVCLTQFISGSLVAPLAYITTMSGIVFHIFGKLALWLPVSSESENS